MTTDALRTRERADDDARQREGADDTNDTNDATEIAKRERAVRLGWVPRDEFRGDPARWTDYPAFLERGEQMLPIANERVRKLDDRLGTTERLLKDALGKLDTVTGQLKESRDTFVEFRQSTANVERRAYERARTELLAEREEAVKAADPAAFREADAKLAELDKTAPKAPPEQKREIARDDDTRDDRRGERDDTRQPERKPADAAPQISETASRWIEDNPWLKTDAKAGAKATAMHGANLAFGMSEEDSLADVTESMKALRPDLFEDRVSNDFLEDISPEGPRRGAAPVHTPSGGGRRWRRGNGRTFDDLPPEAKDAYARFHKQDPKFTKDDYLRDYIWD